MYSLILHGARFQKLRHLRFSLQNAFAFAFSNSFSSAIATADSSRKDGRKGKNFTASYLVDSLGLTSKLAESMSKKVSFENKKNPDSVLNLLRNHGFTDSQISNIITIYPQLLILDSEKSIEPKIQFLQSREGASSSELTEILSKVPQILGMRWEKAISVYYDFVKEVIVADKSSEFVKLCHSSLPLEGSKQGNKMRNVSVLRDLGVPQKRLFSLLTANGGPIHGKERFEESVKKVVEMGYDPTSLKFVQALRFVYGMSDKAIEEKVNAYKRLGFTEEDVWEMVKKWPVSLTHSEKKITQTYETLKKCGLLEDEILPVLNKCPQCFGASEQKIDNSVETFLGLGFSRDEYTMIIKRFPQCICLSAETVKRKTEFLVKEMNWPLTVVVSNPAVLGYSMEKRIVPRCNVIKALMSKRLLGKRSELPPISSVLATTDQAFFNKYVMKHDDKELVAELMAIFTGNRVSSTVSNVKDCFSLSYV